MGTWGPGLQANDTAKDAVSIVEEELEEAGLSLQAFVVKHGVHKLLKEASKATRGRECQGVLGAAEWLAQRNIDVSNEPLVKKALKAERDEDLIDCYAEPTERVRVLELFEKRIKGGLSSEEEKEVDQSNKGLFTRLLKAVDPNNPPSV